ncbi:MAG: CDGSH iron-sulfur domain-containing protein [Pseudonocardia sp.]|uniref:CDGSH iron-sulfur domain-containing protein n=1 Tax=Pseudonocardia sp. TaxID=60912 RepID=UPI001AC946BE|nr:CDGSH iron-sulfur domain-containing protein [Pseudonocardia sp.]MBN9100716.1 CDGSH iron-sulfur domain-containing protein [Pseudonocardia sp.]
MLIRVTPGGPYLVSGGVPLTHGSDVVPTGEVYTLCRCGGSSRKPFCDSTHRRIGVDDDGTADGPGCDPGTDAGPGIEVRDAGPLAVTGVVLQHADGSTAPHGRYTLCRCGASRTKPFCDGGHCSP